MRRRIADSRSARRSRRLPFDKNDSASMENEADVEEDVAAIKFKKEPKTKIYVQSISNIFPIYFRLFPKTQHLFPIYLQSISNLFPIYFFLFPSYKYFQSISRKPKIYFQSISSLFPSISVYFRNFFFFFPKVLGKNETIPEIDGNRPEIDGNRPEIDWK